MRSWPLPAVLCVLVTGVVLLLRRTIAVVTVTGQSMEPTLTVGDRVLVRRVRRDGSRQLHPAVPVVQAEER